MGDDGRARALRALHRLLRVDAVEWRPAPSNAANHEWRAGHNR
jgi:hypothetical protein